MSRRQPPVLRAGSGDTHDARVAVLEKRFSEEMQARCSWCNRVSGARLGQWIEVFLSTPGSGIAPAHVFRCESCETATAGALAGSSVLMVPRRAGRQPKNGSGEAPPPPLDTLSGARELRRSLAPVGTDPRPPKPAEKAARAASTAKKQSKPKAAAARSRKVSGNPAVAAG
ncbi:MAG: hypothetical protein ACRDIU_01350 [Actinomycetota bacterium]